MLNSNISSRFNWGIYKSPIDEQVTALTAVKLAHSCGQQILCCINVAIMDGAAFRAGPLSDVQLQLIQFVFAFGTRFAGREPFIQDDQSPAVPLALILQLSAELAPTSISDMPSEPGVLNHAFDVQIFDADNLIFSDESSSQVVQIVAALIRYFTVSLSDSDPLLASTGAAINLPGKLALLLPQVTEAVCQLAGILNFLASAEHGKVSQAKINADSSANHGQQVNGDFDAEGNEIFAILITLERDHLGIFGWKLFSGSDCPEFCQTEATINPAAFAWPGESKVTGLTAFLESRITWLLSGFNSAVEIRESLILIAEALGKTGRRSFCQPSEALKLPEFCQPLIDVDTADVLLAPLVSLLSGFEAPIPNPSRGTKPMIEFPDLCRARIAADFVRTHDSRHMQIIQHRINL